MAGMELSQPGKIYLDRARDAGLLINCTQETVLRLLPPLTISMPDLKKGVGILEKILDQA